MGVWIETDGDYKSQIKARSHPVWVCGLKQLTVYLINMGFIVTPCMGVWIETADSPKFDLAKIVTPCMGVWIETRLAVRCDSVSACHTLYGCVD